MTELGYFIVPLILSLAAIYFFEKISRKKNFALGIDINKKEKRKTPEATGIVLLLILWVSILGIHLLNEVKTEIFYWMANLTVFSLVGFFDDTKTKWAKKGLGWKERATPIIISSLLFGYLVSGDILFGILIGLFVAVFSSFHNSFAGLNGWEVGSSYIIALFTVFLLIGTELFLYSVVVAGIILGLLVFNLYPARVFPGDSGTLFMGSAVAGLIALTTEKELMFLFAFFYLPHLIDFLFLKMLTNPKDVTQVKMKPYKVLEDGRIAIPDYKGKTRYDFAKLVIKVFGPLREWEIVLINWIIVATNCLLWLIIFGKIVL
jgi:UDP-N-acetylglucosamine--dolichyl-phosphate N-acetylglucosaminephosphotransferase